MKLNNVLVPGYKGFIGSNLWKQKGLLWKGIDLKDGMDIWNVDTDIDCQAVVLLAAHLGQTPTDYRHNLRVYFWLSMLSEMSPNAHVIYTSSAAVYPKAPEGRKQGWEEAEAGNPPTHYGQSKLLGEQILKDTTKHWTVLRLSNVHGNGDGNGVVDRFRKGQNVIYGDGSAVRDYVPVDVVCEAIKRVLKSPKKYDKEIYNISSGVGKTVNDVWKKYGTGVPRHIKERSFDIPWSVLNNTKAKEAGLL